MAVLLSTSLAFDFQIRKKAIPIMMYKDVQTGANNQLGGLNDGLTSVVYHPRTDDAVKKPASEPIASGNTNAMINLYVAFILFLTSFY